MSVFEAELGLFAAVGGSGAGLQGRQGFVCCQRHAGEQENDRCSSCKWPHTISLFDSSLRVVGQALSAGDGPAIPDREFCPRLPPGNVHIIPPPASPPS